MPQLEDVYQFLAAWGNFSFPRPDGKPHTSEDVRQWIESLDPKMGFGYTRKCWYEAQIDDEFLATQSIEELKAKGLLQDAYEVMSKFEG